MHPDHRVEAVIGYRQRGAVALVQADAAGGDSPGVAAAGCCHHRRGDVDADDLGAGCGEQGQGPAGAEADLADPLTGRGGE